MMDSSIFTLLRACKLTPLVSIVSFWSFASLSAAAQSASVSIEFSGVITEQCVAVVDGAQPGGGSCSIRSDEIQVHDSSSEQLSQGASERGAGLFSHEPAVLQDSVLFNEPLDHSVDNQPQSRKVSIQRVTIVPQ